MKKALFALLGKAKYSFRFTFHILLITFKSLLTAIHSKNMVNKGIGKGFYQADKFYKFRCNERMDLFTKYRSNFNLIPHFSFIPSVFIRTILYCRGLIIFYCLLFTLLCSHITGQAQTDDIFFETLNPELGLSQVTVSCIFQDSRGFMWFGTQNGLNRYDGYRFEVFQSKTDEEKSISHNQVNGIAEDSLGNIWVATELGLNRYNYRDNQFLRFYKSSGSKGISNNKVSCIYRDRNGTIWIGTEQGLDCVNIKTLTFSKRTFNNFLYNNRITAIHNDSYGNIWVGTLKGLIKYNLNSDSHQIFTHNQLLHSLSDDHIRCVFEDSNRNLWIGTRNGLNLYDPRNKTFQLFGKDIYSDKILSNNAVKCMTEDSEKNLLIGTNEGLNRLNLVTNELKKYNQKNLIRGNLNHFFIYSLFIDNVGTVWIGTFSGGINYYNTYTQEFRYFNPGNKLVFGSIGQVLEHNGEIWIATGGGGLLNYDMQFNYKGQYLLNPSGPKNYVSNVVRAMALADNRIMIGSDESRILQFNPATGQIIKKSDLYKGYVVNFFTTTSGKVWVCENDTLGLHSFNPLTGEMHQAFYYNSDRKKMTIPYSSCIQEDSEGIYWVGTRYTGIYLYDTNKEKVVRYTAKADSSSLKSNNISTLFIDSHNNLWVGTNGGGISLFDREKKSFKTYTVADGLLDGNIFGILEDNMGNLWISSLSGISKFDPLNKQFTNYYKGNGFPLQEMSEHSFTKLKDGRIVAGGVNGFIVFDPRQIKSNKFIPPVHITGFRLLRSSQKNIGNGLERNFLNGKDKIILKYNQADFIIEYTALNYIFSIKNQYAYRLKGFDKDWNQVGNQRIAIYTNLDPGKYIFQVKASNNDGLWNEEGISLPIKVLPPPWKTWWAYMIYFVVLTGFFFLLVHYLKLENEVKIKQMEHDNSEKAHLLRTRFFTNFSHELRTPLTLIMGPLEDILNRTDLSDPVKNSLNMIQKNTHRLLYLVNQLMDFRKQESGNMKLRAINGKINKFIVEVSMAFNELSVKRGINYSIKGCENEIYLWYDPPQLEKVLFNLLSNAFKNTPSNGRISLELFKLSTENLPPLKEEVLKKSNAAEFIEISISNSGKGIPVKEIEKIFDPFYRIAEDEQSSVGTGIGLSLVKGIVDMHYGGIYVESSPGEGVKFRVFLPLGSDHLDPEQMISDYRGSEHIDHYLIDENSPDEEFIENIDESTKKQTILVIDDNNDIRNYIKSNLKNRYNVCEAGNGKEGLEKASRIIPDLIISDIMMPEIDGLQLCGKLKTDIHTSHIPIILLTARTTYLHVKEGFEVGADDYITKPFNGNLLRLKVNSIIKNRERLKISFGKKIPFEISPSDSKSLDSQFLNKISKIIEKNIANPDFDIEHFSDDVGMSRANLYRKIKSLTNFAPNEFIRNYRLQIALKYLRETDLSISEISYKTGFSNPAYFTNCFKKFHNISPAGFRQNIHSYPNE
jgi:signal transduction histidine kinase/ligand-binding sensor domain-containing protein/AraC-like DNA-binding protein